MTVSNGRERRHRHEGVEPDGDERSESTAWFDSRTAQFPPSDSEDELGT
jgi:hypothetical protein